MNNNADFIKSVEDASFKIIEQLKGNVEKACIIIETEAKKGCPVDQGITRASISHSITLNPDSIVGSIGCSLETAPFVHQGTGLYAKDGNGRKTPWKYEAVAGKYKGWHTTRGQKPQPFLEDAKTKMRSRVEKTLGGK